MVKLKIMARESLEFTGMPKGTVEFNEETCCALERGFEQNPTMVKQLEEAIGENKVKIFKDILFNSLDPQKRPPMKFVPVTEEVKTLYGQIAERELERIEAEDEDDEDISCGHTIDEHIWALKKVVERMKSVVH